MRHERLSPQRHRAGSASPGDALRPDPGAASGASPSAHGLHRRRWPTGAAGGGGRGRAVRVGRRLPALGGAHPVGSRYRAGRGLGRSRVRGLGAGLGPPPGSRLRAHRAGLVAVGGTGRGLQPARPGRGAGQGPQLGEPAPGAARPVVRAGAGGGAPGRALQLGCQPRAGAVGARQRRRCRGPARRAAHRVLVDPGTGRLVRPLRTGQPHRARAPAGPAAAVRPGVADPARRRPRGALVGGARPVAPTASAPRSHPRTFARSAPSGRDLAGPAQRRREDGAGHRATSRTATGGGACCRNRSARRSSSCMPKG